MSKLIEDYKFISNFDGDEKHIYEIACNNLKINFLIKDDAYNRNNFKIKGYLALYFDKNGKKDWDDFYKEYKKVYEKIYTIIDEKDIKYLKNNGIDISNWSYGTVDKIAGRSASEGNINGIKYFLEHYKDDKFMLPKIAQEVISESVVYNEEFENEVFKEVSKYIDTSNMIKKQRCPKCKSTYIHTSYNMLYQQCFDCGYMLFDCRI